MARRLAACSLELLAAYFQTADPLEVTFLYIKLEAPVLA
jgi:hypothetical protein